MVLLDLSAVGSVGVVGFAAYGVARYMGLPGGEKGPAGDGVAEAGRGAHRRPPDWQDVPVWHGSSVRFCDGEGSSWEPC